MINICGVLITIWCMTDISHQEWILGFRNGDHRNVQPRRFFNNDLREILHPKRQNNFVLWELDSSEQVSAQKFRINHNQQRFHVIDRQGLPPNPPQSFNSLHEFYLFHHPESADIRNPVFRPVRNQGFQPIDNQRFQPFRNQAFQPIRQLNLRTINQQPTISPPILHIGFLRSGPKPVPTRIADAKKSDDNEIIHSEIHDINNASLDSSDFHDFRYHGALGPQHWADMFESCKGPSQSPIAIERLNSTQADYGYFSSRNYYAIPSNGTITNNGHTAMVTLPGGATITGGGLPGEFEFLNFHFHWGSDDRKGSEHILEGVRYPLELHMVHWNHYYLTPDAALRKSDGIAVLAVLFHIEPLDNLFLEPIIQALEKIVPSCSNMTFTPNFRLSDLLPIDTRDYYRYQGSLTTPECSESVIWTIFANTLPVSERQINIFRRLLDADNNDRENNHRPVQPLNNRIIYRNGR